MNSLLASLNSRYPLFTILDDKELVQEEKSAASKTEIGFSELAKPIKAQKVKLKGKIKKRSPKQAAAERTNALADLIMLGNGKIPSKYNEEKKSNIPKASEKHTLKLFEQGSIKTLVKDKQAKLSEFKDYGKGNKFRDERRIDELCRQDFMRGTMLGPNDSFKSGIWVDKVFTGRVAIVDKKGDKYVGKIKKNKPAGEGMLRKGDGSGVYLGEFVDGLPDGMGRWLCSNGEKYEGAFKKGLKHGEGIETIYREKFHGLFYKGERSGKGVLTIPGGRVFDLVYCNGTLIS